MESERARKWVKIKASLLRDSRGQFKIVVKEDQGGFYLDAIMETDVRPHYHYPRFALFMILREVGPG